MLTVERYACFTLLLCFVFDINKLEFPPKRFSPFIICTGPDFAGGGPGANIEDGSSLIIHWSSGSHKRSTNWANQYDVYFGGALVVGGPGP